MWQKLQTLPNQQTHRGKILYWHIRDGAVWHQHRKIRRADPATLEVFQIHGGSGFIARDKNHVYHAWTTLKNIDRASFEHIAAYLLRDKNHVYAEHETSLRPIAEADPATFRYLGNDWAADQCHAYYAARRVKHCTRPDTLRLIGACYAADADHVYWDGKLLRQADPATWQPIDNAAGYSRDQHRIYYCERPLPRSTDTASWQYLAHGYSRDRNRVYYWEKILPQADPATWQFVAAAPAFSRDARHVYCYWDPLPEADPASWRHLHDSFSKDLRHVYYGTRIIPRENPTDWNTERARTTDVMRAMRHIAQAQANDTAA